MRHWGALGLVILLAVPVQVHLFPLVLPPAWAPHLGLLIAFVVGLLYGEATGVMVGLLLGLVFDRFAASGVGLHLLVLPLVGLASGMVRRLVPEMTFGNHLIVLLLVVVLVELASAALFHMAGVVWLDGWLVVHRLIPSLIADTVAGTLMLVLTGAGWRRLLW